MSIRGGMRDSNPKQQRGIVTNIIVFHFWNTFVSVIQTGCRVGTVNEPAIQNLHTLLLQFNDIKHRLDTLNAKLADPIRSERASRMSFLL